MGGSAPRERLAFKEHSAQRGSVPWTPAASRIFSSPAIEPTSRSILRPRHDVPRRRNILIRSRTRFSVDEKPTMSTFEIPTDVQAVGPRSVGLDRLWHGRWPVGQGDHAGTRSRRRRRHAGDGHRRQRHRLRRADVHLERRPRDAAQPDRFRRRHGRRLHSALFLSLAGRPLRPRRIVDTASAAVPTTIRAARASSESSKKIDSAATACRRRASRRLQAATMADAGQPALQPQAPGPSAPLERKCVTW